MPDDDDQERSVIIGWRNDPSRVAREFAPDRIYERLFEEVFGEPNVVRSYVVTLHLYVEYWLDRLLTKLGQSTRTTFFKKIKKLEELQALEAELATNLFRVNSLRNIYAHQLDLGKASAAVTKLLEELKEDPYFSSNDPDPLRAVCIQVMFLLEATFHNNCKPPKLPEFPHAALKRRLQRKGRVHWGECETLSKKINGYLEEYVLRCPRCNKGTILRERDATPGFKEAFMSACSHCHLSGDGYYVVLRNKPGAPNKGRGRKRPTYP